MDRWLTLPTRKMFKKTCYIVWILNDFKCLKPITWRDYVKYLNDYSRHS